MIRINKEQIVEVRKQFEVNCLQLTDEIITLQLKNQQILLRLQALSEKLETSYNRCLIIYNRSGRRATSRLQKDKKPVSHQPPLTLTEFKSLLKQYKRAGYESYQFLSHLSDNDSFVI